MLNPPASTTCIAYFDQLDGNLNILMAHRHPLSQPRSLPPPKKTTKQKCRCHPLLTQEIPFTIRSRLGCVFPCSVIARDATFSSTAWPFCSCFFISGVSGTFLDQKYLAVIGSALRNAETRPAFQGDLEGVKMLDAGDVHRFQDVQTDVMGI